MIPVSTISASELAPYLVVGCVALAVLSLIGVGIGLKFLRELRHNIGAELMQEITAKREATPMSVQQPLVVRPDVEAATKLELDKVKEEAHGRISRERREVEQRIDRVEGASNEAIKEIKGDLKENTRLTLGMQGEMNQLSRSMLRLTDSVENFMRNQPRST